MQRRMIDGVKVVRFHRSETEYVGEDDFFRFSIIDEDGSDKYVLYLVLEEELDYWFRRVLNSGVSTERASALRKQAGGIIAIKYPKDQWSIRAVIRDFKRIFRDKNKEQQ